MDKYVVVICSLVILILGLVHSVKAHGSQPKPVEAPKAMIAPKTLQDSAKGNTVQSRAMLMAVPLILPPECKDKKLRQQCAAKLKGK